MSFKRHNQDWLKHGKSLFAYIYVIRKNFNIHQNITFENAFKPNQFVIVWRQQGEQQPAEAAEL